ncbi:hypothetical protein pb186bvf_003489 [Paramecium bursaria]
MKKSFQVKGEVQSFKMVFIGTSSAGKTSIIQRYLGNEFAMKTMCTVGVGCESKIINFNDKTVKIQIWDTAGQERFKSLTKNYYRGCDAVIAVFDVSNDKTFEQVEQWFRDYEEAADKQAVRCLIGNKIDKHRTIQENEARLYAESKGALYFEMSAKENVNIECLDKIIYQLLKDQQPHKPNKLRRKSLNDSTQLDTITKGNLSVPIKLFSNPASNESEIIQSSPPHQSYKIVIKSPNQSFTAKSHLNNKCACSC